jgi:NosR/NirI family nitrous oxide reductase transcriptional regulator
MAWAGAGFAKLAVVLAVALLAHANFAAPARAAGNLGRLARQDDLKALFPAADRFDALQATPPVLRAKSGDEVLGYVFLNSDFVSAIGYSGKPIHVLIAIDRDAVIRGVRLVEHHEPIVLIGIPERKIRAVTEGYVGLNVADFLTASSDHRVDIVSGATVTVMVIDDSILRSAIRVARAYGLGGLAPEPLQAKGPVRLIDTSLSTTEDWATLLGDGSVRRLSLTIAEINRAFEESGDAVAAQRPESSTPEEPYIELYAALVSIPTIGRSLLGEAEYANLRKRLKPGEQAILLAGDGRYSFKGSGYVRGGIFDRFQVIQGDRSIRFRDRYHKRLRRVAAEGAPTLKEVDLFRVPADATFDPAAPWRLELLVARATGPTSKAYLTFDLRYTPPDRYFKVEAVAAPAEPGSNAMGTGTDRPPLWQKLWRQKTGETLVLLAALALLTLIFFFQDWLAKRPQLADRVRMAFLAFTLFGIGFYANAQLSVVNVMTFFNALITDFRWEYFLMEPLVFILWGSVAASLLFWGRGPFCGWICPFGALQELLNRAAKALRVPQIPVPWWLHERLWPFKYMIFLGLFGVSLYSLAWAEQLAEVEPFKTAIVLKFVRDWPYVVFAVALLAAGLFIERFYCRYLCPLGAALAIPGRLRMFEWLKRYRECGSPCQRCGNECMVQAIHPEGQINPNECLYCLHCQVLYHDDHRCPVVIQRRLKRERREALSSKNLPRPKVDKTGEPKTLADFMPN